MPDLRGYRLLPLLGLVTWLGCSPAPAPDTTSHDSFNIRPDHFLTTIFRAEDGSCWQLLTGGRAYQGETRRGSTLNVVAAIEIACPQKQK